MSSSALDSEIRLPVAATIDQPPKRLHPATRKLHESVIRLVKGIIAAWEQWLKDIS